MSVIQLTKSTIKHNKRVRKIVSKLYYYLKNNKKNVLGVDNNLEFSDSFLSNVNIDIKGNNNQIIIEPMTRLSNCQIYMRGDNHKLIIRENCIISGRRFWFEDNNCLISIGRKTTVGDALFAVTEPNSQIIVGEDCMFSNGIDIRTGDSHSIIDLDTNKRINFGENIHIGDHVWIGAYVKILKGVSIERDSVVGINSIVTKTVPRNSIVAGSPVKVVKQNITWDRERLLQ